MECGSQQHVQEDSCEARVTSGVKGYDQSSPEHAIKGCGALRYRPSESPAAMPPTKVAPKSNRIGRPLRLVDWTVADVCAWLVTDVPFEGGEHKVYADRFSEHQVDGLSLVGMSAAHPALAGMPPAGYAAFEDERRVLVTGEADADADVGADVGAQQQEGSEYEEEEEEEGCVAGMRVVDEEEECGYARVGGYRYTRGHRHPMTPPLLGAEDAHTLLRSPSHPSPCSCCSSPPAPLLPAPSPWSCSSSPHHTRTSSGSSSLASLARSSSLSSMYPPSSSVGSQAEPSRAHTYTHSHAYAHSHAYTHSHGSGRGRYTSNRVMKPSTAAAAAASASSPVSAASAASAVDEVQSLRGEITAAEERECTVKAQLCHLDDLLKESMLVEYLPTRTRWTPLPGEPPVEESEGEEWVPRFVALTTTDVACYLKATDLHPQITLPVASVGAAGSLNVTCPPKGGSSSSSAGGAPWFVFHVTTSYGLRLECATHSCAKVQMWLSTVHEAIASGGINSSKIGKSMALPPSHLTTT